MRTAFFWVIMHEVVVIPFQRFETTCQSHVHGSRSQESKFLTLEDGTDRLFRNVGKKLPLLAE